MTSKTLSLTEKKELEIKVFDKLAEIPELEFFIEGSYDEASVFVLNIKARHKNSEL